MADNYRSVSKAQRSEPVSLDAETPPRSLRKLGSFDVNPDPTVREADVDRFQTVVRSALKSGHSFTDAIIAEYTGGLSSTAGFQLRI